MLMITPSKEEEEEEDDDDDDDGEAYISVMMFLLCYCCFVLKAPYALLSFLFYWQRDNKSGSTFLIIKCRNFPIVSFYDRFVDV